MGERISLRRGGKDELTHLDFFPGYLSEILENPVCAGFYSSREVKTEACRAHSRWCAQHLQSHSRYYAQHLLIFIRRPSLVGVRRIELLLQDPQPCVLPLYYTPIVMYSIWYWMPVPACRQAGTTARIARPRQQQWSFLFEALCWCFLCRKRT